MLCTTADLIEGHECTPPHVNALILSSGPSLVFTSRHRERLARAGCRTMILQEWHNNSYGCAGDAVMYWIRRQSFQGLTPRISSRHVRCHVSHFKISRVSNSYLTCIWPELCKGEKRLPRPITCMSYPSRKGSPSFSERGETVRTTTCCCCGGLVRKVLLSTAWRLQSVRKPFKNDECRRLIFLCESVPRVYAS